MRRREKLKEFRRLTIGQLQNLLLEKRRKLLDLRFNLSAGKLKNIKEVRETKKDIARILMILKEKQQKS